MNKQIIGNATLYCGDCMEILPQITGVDGLITDPPYSSGGMTIASRSAPALSKYLNNKSYNDFYGDNRDGRSWQLWVVLWLGRSFLGLNDGAYVMIFTDWRQLPLLSDAFQAGGFIWRGLVPWDKTASSRAPHCGYFRHQCEYIVWGSKGVLKKSTWGGPWPGLISVRVNPSEKHHMTGKPIPLMGELVQAIPPGGTILDPFMGSGSTGVAAVLTGRHFIGIELSEFYFDVACQRLEAAQNDLLTGVPEVVKLL